MGQVLNREFLLNVIFPCMKTKRVLQSLIVFITMAYLLWLLFSDLSGVLPLEYAVVLAPALLAYLLWSKKKKKRFADDWSAKNEKRINSLEDHEPSKFIKYIALAGIFSMFAILGTSLVEHLLSKSILSVVYAVFIFVFVASIFILFAYERKHPGFEKYYTNKKLINWKLPANKPNIPQENKISEPMVADPYMETIRSNAEKQFKNKK
jgi:hypothetical protein